MILTTRRIQRPLLSLLLVLSSAVVASAQRQLQWVEVGLVLDGDGRATVTYQTRWQASGTMHGFYFEGERATPRFTGGSAELPGRRQVPLAITSVSAGKWDVVLADGEAWGPGEATYTFTYEADLAAAGLVALTRDAAGRSLVVFNWAPVQWDEALQHETLVVAFKSVAAPRAGELALEDATGAGLRTEPWVNERYKITYRGVCDPPILWVRFHQDAVPARGDHRVQLYLPSERFPGVAAAAERREAELRAERARALERERQALLQRTLVLLPLLLALGLVGFVVAAKKLSGLARATATAPDVLWERDDWEPPRLRVSSFRKAGKVAELQPLEALALLGLPFQVILAMLLDRLEQGGRLRRETRDGKPWLARAGSEPPADEAYTAFVWKALGPSRHPCRRTSPAKVGELLVGTVQRKAWDADLDATREHYRKLFEEMFPDVAAVAGRKFGEKDDPAYYPWWVSRHSSSGPSVWRSESGASAPAPFSAGGGRFGGGGARPPSWDAPVAALGAVPARASMAAYGARGPRGRLRALGLSQRLPQRLPLGLPQCLPLRVSQRVPLGLPQRLSLRLRLGRLALSPLLPTAAESPPPCASSLPFALAARRPSSPQASVGRWPRALGPVLPWFVGARRPPDRARRPPPALGAHADDRARGGDAEARGRCGRPSRTTG